MVKPGYVTGTLPVLDNLSYNVIATESFCICGQPDDSFDVCFSEAICLIMLMLGLHVAIRTFASPFCQGLASASAASLC